MNNVHRWLVLMVLLGAIMQSAAAFPSHINLVGRLTSASGSSLSGTYQFNASIYDAPTGGTRVYQYNTSLTTTTRGAYDLTLKDVNLTFSGPYYLGLSIGQNNVYEAEMTPRMNLSVVPYAYRANSSDDLNTANSYVVSGINATGSASFVNLNASGNVSALYFSGNGSQLTSVSVVDAWVNTSGDVMSGGLVGKDANFTNINASGTLFGIGNLIINNLFNVTAGTGVVRTAGTYYINGSEVCTAANGFCGALSPCTATGSCGNITYLNYDNGQNNLTINGTAFHVDGANGRVGIGTRTPAVKLDIAALTSGTALAIGNDNYYAARQTDGTVVNIMGIDTSNNLRINSTTKMIFTVGSETLIISSGSVNIHTGGQIYPYNFFVLGNSSINRTIYTTPAGVGIGTANPVAKLHVNGSVVAGDGNFSNLNASGTFTGFGNVNINDQFNITAATGNTKIAGDLVVNRVMNTTSRNLTVASAGGSVIITIGQ